MSGFDDNQQAAVDDGPDTGIVKIERYDKRKGVTTVKEYQTVALRIKNFRDDHPDWSVITEIIYRDEECAVMKCTIFGETDTMPLATGHSEEYRSSSLINKTSALENAETSAIGRALACLGYGGSEFASANEVINARAAQADMEAAAKQEKPSQVDPGFIQSLELAATRGVNALQRLWESGTPEQRKAHKNLLPALKMKAKAAEEIAIEEAQLEAARQEDAQREYPPEE